MTIKHLSYLEIVENILIEIAKRFIGRASNIRDEKLEEINAKHAALKADEDRKNYYVKSKEESKHRFKEIVFL